MCIFSGPVKSVAQTNIFARVEGDRQFIVYSMNYGSNIDVAMILPLPVAENTEDAVEFLNLKNYDKFFKDLDSGFPAPRTLSFGGSRMAKGLTSASLKIHDVGDFEASFVPSINDFNRLDPRFKLPQDVWENLPQYKDYGFAVFKLKSTQTPDSGFVFANTRSSVLQLKDVSKAKTVHPMAFSFKTRNASQLFYPTVHVHDKQVHETEHFDHALYFQGDFFGELAKGSAEKSTQEAKTFVEVNKTQGIVDGQGFCYKLELRGNFPNDDIILG